MMRFAGKWMVVTPLLAVLALPLCAAVVSDDASAKVAFNPQAEVAARRRAFVELRSVATEKSIPALAQLLNDSAWADAARAVLEVMPGPAADRALLQALDGASNATLRAGIVNSLGNRRCSEAAPAIAKLLANSEPVVATVALNALGDIGSSRAMEALLTYQPVPALKIAWADALVRAADALQRRDRTAAVKGYQLAISKGPDAQLGAATIGLAHVSDDPASVVIDALTSKRRPRQLAALALIRSGEFGAPLTQAVDRVFATLPPDLQVQVLSVLQDRGDRAAVSTARAAIRMTEPAVRAAAVKLLSVVGEESDAAALLPLMPGDDEVAAAARLALARLPGESLARLLRDAFGSGGPRRDAALEVLVERGDRAFVPELLRPELYGDETFGPRVAAAVATLGTPADLTPALSLYEKLPADRRPVLDAALRRLATKDPSPERATAAVRAAVERVPVGERGNYYLLLAAVGGDAALEAVATGAKSGPVEQRKSALRALGNWRDTRAADTLLAVTREDADPGVRAIAVRSAASVYSKSAFGGGNAPVPALVPAAINGLRKLWPLATQRAERNAILVALRGLKDPQAKAAADELESTLR